MIIENSSVGKGSNTGSSSQPMVVPVCNTSEREHEHFATDHLLTNLKGRTLSSGFVTGMAQVAQMGLNFISIVVLARLLLPQDFGLVAMVTAITGFLRIFNDAGLSTATVQREQITHAQVSNLFWANVCLGGFISLVLAVSAPAVAWLYREPRLIGVTIALSITFLLTAASVQHMALLKRQMRFRTIALIQVGSMLAGVMVGIGMAWLKFGYWSLVGLQLSTVLVASVLTWYTSRWRPQLPARGSGTRPLLRFGANLTASSFIWSLARGTDGLLIGRIYGSASLGFYSRAGALLLRPIDQCMSPIEAVIVPTLSRLQAQPERYRRMVLQVFEVIALAGFLFAGLLLALSRPLTLVVLGPKWEASAPIFAGFTLVALYTPLACVSGWLLTSQARGRDVLRLSSIGSAITFASFFIGLPFGPTGVAMCYSASCLLICLPVSYYLTGRSGPVTTRDLWSRFFTHLPVWGVVCGATFLARLLTMGAAPWAQLLVSTPIGLGAGAAFISIYPPSRRAAINLVSNLKELKRARAVSAE